MGRLTRQHRIRCRLACEVLDRGRRPVRAMIRSLSAGGLGLEARLRIEQGDAIRLRILPHRGGRAVTVGAIVWNDRPMRGVGRKGDLRMLGCVVSDPPQSYLDLMAEVEERNGADEPLPPPARGNADGKPQVPRESRASRARRNSDLDPQVPRESRASRARRNSDLDPQVPRNAPLTRARDVPEARSPVPPSPRVSGGSGVPDVEPLVSIRSRVSRGRGVPDVDLPRSRDPLPPPKPPPEELLPSFRVRVKQVGGHRTRTFRARARSLSEAGDRVRAVLSGAEGSWEVLDAVKESDNA